LDRWNELATLIRQGHSFSGRERNCASLNLGDVKSPRFSDVSASWGLDLIDDARGVALVDWDDDGDLDLWFANRTGPRVRLMINQLVESPRYIKLKLVGTDCNRDAIGARVTLVTKQGASRIRTVRAGEGFLSQSSKVVHLGLASGETVDTVFVRWPGDSENHRINGLSENGCFQVIQGNDHAELVPTRARLVLEPGPIDPVPVTAEARVVLSQRVPLPELGVMGEPDAPRDRDTKESRGTLVNLWASWCGPCLEELSALKLHAAALNRQGIRIVPLSVDDDVAAAEAIVQRLELPWEHRMANTDQVTRLNGLLDAVLYRQHPMPVPCSFLFDSRGEVAVIYKGAVSVEQLIADAQLLDAPHEVMLAAAHPFPGRHITPWFNPTPINLAKTYLDGGYYDDAKRSLQPALESGASREAAWRVRLDIAKAEGNLADQRLAMERILSENSADLVLNIKYLFLRRQEIGQAEMERRLEQLVTAANSDADALTQLAQAYASLGRATRALELLQQSLSLDSHHAEALMGMAMFRQAMGELPQAITHYRTLLEHHPDRSDAMNNLAWLLIHGPLATRDSAAALALAQAACEQTSFSQPAYLDTLGDALHAAGQRERALRVWRDALRLARRDGNRPLVEKLQARLDE
jgi:tetratricopeptide (TPR) repeat protein